MNMYPHLAQGKSEIDIEDLFSGSLCRCTGYRSILCAMKTYAADGNASEIANTPAYVLDESVGYGNGAVSNPNVDVVDIPIPRIPTQPTLLSHGKQPQQQQPRCSSHSKIHSLPSAGCSSSSSGRIVSTASPRRLPRLPQSTPMHTWISPAPASLAELLGDIQQGAYGSNYKLVVGNTSYGVFPQFEWAGVQALVDISGIPELNGVTQVSAGSFQTDKLRNKGAMHPGVAAAMRRAGSAGPATAFLKTSEPQFKYLLSIGASTPIQVLLDYLLSPAVAGSDVVCSAIAAHLKRVAGHQVRSVGSVGGSLMMARFWNFPSDTWLCLEGALASLLVYLPSQQAQMQMTFQQVAELCEEFVIVAIYLPLWLDPVAPMGTASSRQATGSVGSPPPPFFSCARVAQRLQNSHPLINSAIFLYGGSSPSLSVLYGNIGPANCSNTSNPNGRGALTQVSTAHYRLSSEACALIIQAWTNGWEGSGYTLDSVLDTVRNELLAAAAGTSANGDISLRCDIATNLLLKFCIVSLGASSSPADVSSVASSIYAQRTAAPSRGSQAFLVDCDESEDPVSEPMIKRSALGQTSGAANYTHTLRPNGCLHATFVTSWAACGALHLASAESALANVVTWLSATYGIVCLPTDFTLFTAADLGAANLLNGDLWTFNSTPPAPQSCQQFPTRMLASVEVVFAGQPVAILVGPSESVVNQAAEYLQSQEAGYVQVTVDPNNPPILSVADSKARGSIVVDQNPNWVAPTKFLTVSADPTLPGAFKALNSVSRNAAGPCVTPPGGIDFSRFQQNPQQYLVVQGTHAVPAQAHFYLETQSAVALVDTDVAPAYTTKKKKHGQAAGGPAQSPTASSSGSGSRVEAEDLDPLTASTRLPRSDLPATGPAKPKVDPSLPTKHMTVYSSSQCVMAMKACVSTLLSIARPDANWEVTVLVPQLGGGYGGKEVQSNFTAIAAAFCTARLRVPVRIALSRETDMRMIGRRHPVEAAFTAAADRSTGRILALQLNVDADAGCTFDCTLPVADLVVLTADTAYNIEEFTVTMDSWFTNKASSTAMRSFGVVQVMHMTEYVLERVSEELSVGGGAAGLTPFSIRAANFYPYSDVPGTYPLTPAGQEVPRCNLDGIWDDLDTMMISMEKLPVFDGIRGKITGGKNMLSPAEVAARLAAAPVPKPRSPHVSLGAGYAHVASLVDTFNSSSRYQKLGLGLMPMKYGISFTTVKLNLGECVVEIQRDGVVNIQCPGIEMGQGLDTKMIQIAALKLTLWSKWIRYSSGVVNSAFFTPTSPAGSGSSPWILMGTGASTGSDLNGGAICVAANTINVWIASQLNYPGSEIWAKYVAQGCRWFQPARYNPDGTIKQAQSDLWPQAAAILASMPAPAGGSAGQPFMLPLQYGPFYYYYPNLTNVVATPGVPHVGNIFYYFNYAAAASLVLVDVLTGEHSLLQTDLMYDAGLSLNPALDLGQMEGGFVQGLGYNTCEEVAHNDAGQPTAINTWSYKLPTTLEIPQQFNVRLYPLASHIKAWTEEEKKRQTADATAATSSGAASSSGSAPRSPPSSLHLSHPFNRLRKSWLRLDSLHQVIDSMGVQSSKSVGEPPLVMANTVYLAIRNAIKAYANDMRKETTAAGSYSSALPVGTASAGEVVLQCPATPFNIRQAVINLAK